MILEAVTLASTNINPQLGRIQALDHEIKKNQDYIQPHKFWSVAQPTKTRLGRIARKATFVLHKDLAQIREVRRDDVISSHEGYCPGVRLELTLTLRCNMYKLA